LVKCNENVGLRYYHSIQIEGGDMQRRAVVPRVTLERLKKGPVKAAFLGDKNPKIKSQHANIGIAIMSAINDICSHVRSSVYRTKL
jgi:hypothetical protein